MCEILYLATNTRLSESRVVKLLCLSPMAMPLAFEMKILHFHVGSATFPVLLVKNVFIIPTSKEYTQHSTILIYGFVGYTVDV